MTYKVGQIYFCKVIKRYLRIDSIVEEGRLYKIKEYNQGRWDRFSTHAVKKDLDENVRELTKEEKRAMIKKTLKNG